MWAGYEEALTRYGLDVCAVWCAAGRADTCAATLTVDLATACGIERSVPSRSWPSPGNCRPGSAGTDLHLSHRSSLLRKDPAHYRPIFGDDVPDDLEYVWPASDRPRRCLR